MQDPTLATQATMRPATAGPKPTHERAAESTGTPARPRRTYPSPQDELLHRARTAPSTTRRLIAGGVLR